MSSLRKLLAGGALWSGLALVVGAADAPRPTPEEIARKIQQLGDDNFLVREAATRYLWQAGKSAESALAAAAKSDDPEIARRAREILDKFKWGLYPDTPKNVVDLIEKYRGGDPMVRQAVVPEFLKLGATGYAALLKIAAAEENDNARQELYRQLAESATEIVADLLVEQNTATVEELLQLSLVNDSDVSLRNYAAWLLLSGRLEPRIRELEAAKGPASQVQKNQELLVYLYRARGDLPAARAAAEKSEREFLIRCVLYELGDWKALASRPLPNDGRELNDIEVLGFQAAYHRLAGNADDLAKAVAAIKKFADDQLEGERSNWYAAKALLVNEQLSDAFALLHKDQNPVPVFDLLIAQLRHREAFALADRLRNDTSQDLASLELKRAKALYQLGQKDEALQRFSKLADQAAQKADVARMSAVVETLAKLGLHETALEPTAWLLDHLEKDQTPRQALAQVFPKQEDVAEVWWWFLRKKHPKEATLTTLKRLDALLAPRPDAVRVKELAVEAERALETDNVFAESLDPIKPYLALGETCQKAGLDELAERFFAKPVAMEVPAPLKAAALTRLGDFLVEKKRYQSAAERYRQAWDRDRKHVTALYLHGWALVQAGHADEGKKKMELAHWLPLGDDMARHNLAEELSRRGLADAARRQHEFILRTGDFESWYLDDALRHAAYDAAGRKEHLRAADLFERFLLRCLHTSRSFVETSAYLVVPHLVHRHRARGLLSAGKLDEARKEVQLCQTLLPGDVELPILLVASLEKAGQKKEADELYAQAAAHLNRMCADYPASGWAHNSYAWLAACCRRDLDKALDHANQAVALAPRNASYLDTLAEVWFQKGDPKKAIELMKQCLALEPKNEYFQNQLKRFEAGDPSVDVPEVAN